MRVVGPWVLLASCTLPACGTSSAPAPVGAGAGSIAFPPGFVFGTAIAGFQADMGCPTLASSACTDPNSDWFAFTTSPTTVNDPTCYLSGQNPAVMGHEDGVARAHMCDVNAVVGRRAAGVH